MPRHCFLLGLLSLILCLWPGLVTAQDVTGPPPARVEPRDAAPTIDPLGDAAAFRVLRAAQEGLHEFWNGPVADRLEEFAPNRTPGSRPSLGYGCQIYSVLPDELLSNPTLPLSELIQPTGIWQFVIRLDNTPVALLQVTEVNGRWRAVSFGAAELAREIDQVSRDWPLDEGCEHRFIRIYQATSDLMLIAHGGEPIGYLPLLAARVSMKTGADTLDSDQLLDEADVQSAMRNLVRLNTYSAE